MYFCKQNYDSPKSLNMIQREIVNTPKPNPEVLMFIYPNPTPFFAPQNALQHGGSAAFPAWSKA